MTEQQSRFETFSACIDAVYVALASNVLLVVGCLPLIGVLLLGDPAPSPPLIALAAPWCVPGVCATFAVFADFTRHGSTTVVGTYARAWRASWRPATSLGVVSTCLLAGLAVGARMLWGRPAGAVVLPVLAVTAVLVASSSVLTAVILAERPAVPVAAALRASLYLGVRRWYLTGLSLVVLALLETLLAIRPALALGLAAAPMLYVVWANSRFTLDVVLGAWSRPGVPVLDVDPGAPVPRDEDAERPA